MFTILPIASSSGPPRLPLCRVCRLRRAAFRGKIRFSQSQTRLNSSHGTSEAQPQPGRTRLSYIPLSLFILPPILWYLSQTPSPAELSPAVYSDHPVSSTRRISEQHKEVVVPLPPGSCQAFSPTTAGDTRALYKDEGSSSVIKVHHVMVKSPDLMIERPYTPVNDVSADREIRLVVKRVKGGEVGRLVHSLQQGQDIGLRGPIPTFSIDPTMYDRIIMISSGTGVAPFLQFLSKLSKASSVSSPILDLVHAMPEAGRADWATSPETSYLPGLQSKHGENLTIHRFDAGTLPAGQVAQVLRSTRAGERLMVLVCLPPSLMRPLCGPLTVTLQQGELTGILRDLGLSPNQVLKLE